MVIGRVTVTGPAPAELAATTRQAAVASTVTTQATLSANTQVVLRSVPAPRPWATATGQQA